MEGFEASLGFSKPYAKAYMRHMYRYQREGRARAAREGGQILN